MPEPVVVLAQRRGERSPEPLDPGDWACGGLVEQIPADGDLLPVTLGERALHVRREPGGGLSAAYNVLQYGGCGSLPVQCLGGRKITCPIRSCAFSRDGGPLPAADEAAQRTVRQFVGFNPEKRRPVALARWGPFILLNTEAAAGDEPAQRLAELAAAGGPPVAALRCVEWHTAPAVAAWPEIGARLARFMRDPATAPSRLPVANGDVDGPTDAGVHVAFANLMVGFTRGRALALILKPIGPLTSEVTVAVLGPAAGAAGTGDAGDAARPWTGAAREAWSLLLGDVRPARAVAHAGRPG
ncbi:MAG: hypothetical protein QOC64_682 [Solirubrobacteraceae bacterium]|nr:hypothetical protein [Solirubrobacteraceae bacterium]